MAQHEVQHRVLTQNLSSRFQRHHCPSYSVLEPDPQGSYTPRGPDCRWNGELGSALPPAPSSSGHSCARSQGPSRPPPEGCFSQEAAATCWVWGPRGSFCYGEGFPGALGSQGQEGASDHSPLLSELISLRPWAPGRCLECLQLWDPAHPRRAYRARQEEASVMGQSRTGRSDGERDIWELLEKKTKCMGSPGGPLLSRAVHAGHPCPS